MTLNTRWLLAEILNKKCLVNHMERNASDPCGPSKYCNRCYLFANHDKIVNLKNFAQKMSNSTIINQQNLSDHATFCIDSFLNIAIIYDLTCLRPLLILNHFPLYTNPKITGGVYYHTTKQLKY